MILDEIAESAKRRVAEKKSRISAEEMQAAAMKKAEVEDRKTEDKKKNPRGGFAFPFEKALRGEDISFICEVKKASPSKGIIAEHFPYLEIAKEYEKAGAAAISCLTEPEYFLGADRYLKEIAEKVSIPVLRKDFTVDSYQIYEAKVLGAGAVLLICAILGDEQLKEYIEIADSLGLSALVEAHDEREISRALACGARILGVNNRNLKDFTVNVENSLNLRRAVPKDIIFVAESGIRTAEDIEKLRQGNVQAVLIGETLMRCRDKKAMLDELRGR